MYTIFLIQTMYMKLKGFANYKYQKILKKKERF